MPSVFQKQRLVKDGSWQQGRMTNVKFGNRGMPRITCALNGEVTAPRWLASAISATIDKDNTFRCCRVPSNMTPNKHFCFILKNSISTYEILLVLHLPRSYARLLAHPFPTLLYPLSLSHLFILPHQRHWSKSCKNLCSFGFTMFI
jgi:hypothetical protein